jgi:Protein of unknown function (DUF4244)
MQRLCAWWLSRPVNREDGQGTVEYVLIMVAVAAIAVILISWARSGSGKSTLTSLFESVMGLVGRFVRS